MRTLLQSADARDLALGATIALLDRCHFRPGNPHYAKHNGSYGATTLRSRHVTFDEDVAVIEFKGKKGAMQRCTLNAAKEEVMDASVVGLSVCLG